MTISGGRFDDAWVPETAVQIADALSALLDDLEPGCEWVEDELPPDPLPLSTGVASIDKALGGGLRLGAVAIVEAELASQANAIAFSVMRNVCHPVLLDMPCVREATTWLVAGQAGIPAVSVASGSMSDREWALLPGALSMLASRQVHLSASQSSGDLERIVAKTRPLVLVVQSAGWFVPSAVALSRLVHLACTAGLAVLWLSQGVGDLPDWSSDAAFRIGVHPHCLGSRATVVRTDEVDMLVATQLDIDCIRGVVV